MTERQPSDYVTSLYTHVLSKGERLGNEPKECLRKRITENLFPVVWSVLTPCFLICLEFVESIHHGEFGKPRMQGDGQGERQTSVCFKGKKLEAK